MALKLADVLVYFKGDQTGLDTAMRQSETKTRGWAQRIGGLAGGALSTMTGMLGSRVIARAGDAVVDMVRDAAPLQGISTAFQGITGDSEAAMDALREGALGMVSDAALMENYNTAAQLVGKTFADQLPDAMGYLGKVSAATGQDMGFMLDSLTKGVGRLSPMILDNLGIQVNLTEANDAYALSIGKAASELTKEEQQAALMQQVLAKLAENTAAMPDITDNASTKMAQLQTTFQNIKDTVGMSLLPIMTALLTPISELATEYGPMVVEWAKEAGIWLGENLPGMIAKLSTQAGPVFENLGSLMESLGLLWSEHGDTILMVIGAILTAIEGAVIIASGALSTLMALISGDTEAWADAWLTTVTGFIDLATGLVGSSAEEFLASWRYNFEMIPKIIQQLIDAAWQKLEDFKQMVKDAVASAIESITGFNPGELVGLGGRYGSQNSTQNVTMYGATFNGVSDAGGLMTQLSNVGG